MAAFKAHHVIPACFPLRPMASLALAGIES